MGFGRSIGVKTGAPQDCKGTPKCRLLRKLFSRMSIFCRHKVAKSNTGTRALAILRNYLVSNFCQQISCLDYSSSVPLSIYNNNNSN